MLDPEIHELKEEIKRLQNSVHRLASMIKAEHVREEKEVSRETDEGEEYKRRDRGVKPKQG